jgi:hypothetical protein
LGRKACLVRKSSKKRLARVDARAAELEDRWRRLRSLRDPANRLCNILYIGRLQSGQAAAEHRIDRKLAEEPEDGSEKRIVRSEHHCRAHEKCIGERSPDGQLAFAALSDVVGW